MGQLLNLLIGLRTTRVSHPLPRKRTKKKAQTAILGYSYKRLFLNMTHFPFSVSEDKDSTGVKRTINVL